MPKQKLIPIEQLVAMLDEFGHQTLDKVEEQGMDRLMNILEAKAVELAPTDTGNLEGSTTVRVHTRGDNIVGQLRFGAPYSATVHELPEHARGPLTQQKPGNEFGLAGPKYLERPLRGFQHLMQENLGRFLQETWAGARRGRR